MKPYLLPTATALVGFALAWIAKPEGENVVGESSKTEQAAPVRPTRTGPLPRPESGPGVRPKEVRAGDFPLAEEAENGPKTLEEGKMLRLTEALDLSIDQQGSIIQLMEDVQAKVNPDLTAIEDLTARGNAVLEGLQKVLTPEQFAKFQEIQIRERDNRAELRAQRMLADTIEFIDLSPEQRDEVVSRLRQKSKADLQAIPAAATLLFEKSILPAGGKEISPDGLLLLTKMGEKLNLDDPMKVQAEVMNRHKQELEETLECFDGVLTAGQMGQYYASLAEKKATLDRIRDGMAQRALPEEPVDPANGPAASETPDP